jgi:hypothetical protein
LKLFGHSKKKERPEPAPGAMYVQVPVMVPAPCASAPAGAAPPCASNPAGAASPGCGRQQTSLPGENHAAIAAAGQDLQATIERLKAQRAQRESELAAIDAALAPVTAPTRSTAKVVPASLTGANVPASLTGANRNEIRDLNDKLDYLTALIDALAEDVRKSDPKRPLPAFDELNGLRKLKP